MNETIWIAYLDMGSEGKSEPLRAFDTEALATVWMSGCLDSYGSGGKIIELPIIRSPQPRPESET